ncbi:MAG: succinyl-diaminopimelate desuccinylase [Candidatus Eremiobacteraeota bacterium]|nr:succinyl-diaminopimelate desuccinylase [Candidatus Eremiobacteraeota bacterium]MCW5867584.1 succinyl-diaminopimelate desuccinylase [Candidatus Eremiobacteraeota bacterium]
MSELLRKAEWLVSIPSPTTFEQEICRQLLEWVAEKFPQASPQRFREGFRFEPSPPSSRPRVALVGHLDTVPPANRQHLGVRDGLLFGCGASDMKAGVAVMMEALEQWESFDCDLVGLFYDREEGPYADNGLDPLLDGLGQVDFAVVFEPTNNEIHAGCVGSLQARVHFQGQRAHSARPWQGQNAIYLAIPLLERLRGLERRAVVSQGLEFFEVTSATQANTQGPTNAVPEMFSLNLNARFAPGKSSEQAIRELESLVAGEARLEIYDVAPSGAVRLENGRLQQWISQQQLRVMPKQAWTDVARLDARGIPAFNFGPGDPAQAHQAEEHVSLQALEENFRLLQALLNQHP